MSYFNFDSDKFAKMHEQNIKNSSTSRSNSSIYRFPMGGEKTRIRLLPNPVDVQQYPHKELLFYRIESLSENGRPLEVLSPTILKKDDPIDTFIKQIENNQSPFFKNISYGQKQQLINLFKPVVRYYHPFYIRGEKELRYWECSRYLHEKISESIVIDGKTAFFPDGFDFEVWKEQFNKNGQNRTRTVFQATSNCDFGFSEDALKEILDNAPKLLKEFKIYESEQLSKIIKDVLNKNNFISQDVEEELDQPEDTITFYEEESVEEDQNQTNQIDIIGEDQKEVKDEIQNIFGDLEL